MKIKTKLIASALSLAAVASVPALTAFADYATCTTNVDSQEISVSLGSTPECLLIDNDEFFNMPLTYVQCTAGNYYFLGFFRNSYEWVKVRAAFGLTVTTNAYAAFLSSDGKTVVLDQSCGNTTYNDFSLIELLNKDSRMVMKEGHILVTCNRVKQSTHSKNVNTYVNYAFGY